MSKQTALERLLRPKTVAVFGGDSAAEVVRQCKAIGFDGDIWAVNPKRKELAGMACVASLDDLPGVPDASFIAAPPQASLQIIRDLAAKGATGAVCFAAGFAETGAQGAELQQQLREAAGDMAIIGPNCHGYLNYLDGVALWPDEHGGQRTDQGVAIITQSGNIGINLTMQRRGLDVAYVISIGNNSMLHMHEYIDTLLNDSRVTAIGLYIEGLQDVTGFSGAAIRAMQKGVPIVALKSGRSSRGAEITMSHTGSLAGSDQLYAALFARLGIARCNTVSQFLETLKFLSVVGALPDNTIGSMSCSGGEAAIVADNAELLGLETPTFTDRSVKKLQALLGPNVDVSNPLDYHLYVWGDYDKLSASYAEVLGNEFACTLLVLDYPPGDDNDDEKWQIAERALLAAVAKTHQRAVIVSSLPETMPEKVRDRLKTAGITPMQGIEDCLLAIRAAAQIGAAQRNVANIRPVAARTRVPGDSTILDEWDSKQALARSGVSIPDGKVCNQDETVTCANSLGYPVVLKALSAQLAHKSEAGGVAVGLRDAVAVQKATDRMAADFDRFLVEQMIGPGVAELIVGVSRDDTFGLTLLLGTGGTLVELLDDTVSLLLPVRRDEIRTGLASLKASTLIHGYRGGPAGDLEAVLDAIEAIARYAEANSDTLIELDVNPLIVTPEDAVAADALIRIGTHDLKE
ncbi:MAG: acetate--CoA ligase family protein [Proteobacteria bacterium]|nr:acetate--CoA ligase family protein [Pseudomonadota bacterium]